MNTFIRLSSSLTSQVAVGLQQTKDITVRIASNAATGALGVASSFSTNPITSSLPELTQETLGVLENLKSFSEDGAVLFFPLGPFQRYLVQLEDVVLSHLIVYDNLDDGKSLQEFRTFAKDFLSKSDTTHIKLLKGRSDWYGEEFNFIYAKSPIAEIAAYVRVMALTRPSIVFDSLDQILIKLKLNDSCKPLLTQKLRNQLKLFESILPSDIIFFPMIDEPFTEIIHLNWMFTLSTRDTGIIPKSFSIYIHRAGSHQVDGYYYPMNTTDPCYESNSGYRIQRFEVSSPLLEMDHISKNPNNSINELVQGVEGVQIIPKIIYIWILCSPILHSNYYICSSIIRSPLPPATGWHVAEHGHLPVPVIELQDETGKSKDTSSSLTNQDGSGVSRSSFLLANSLRGSTSTVAKGNGIGVGVAARETDVNKEEMNPTSRGFPGEVSARLRSRRRQHRKCKMCPIEPLDVSPVLEKSQKGREDIFWDEDEFGILESRSSEGISEERIVPAVRDSLDDERSSLQLQNKPNTINKKKNVFMKSEENSCKFQVEVERWLERVDVRLAGRDLKQGIDVSFHKKKYERLANEWIERTRQVKLAEVTELLRGMKAWEALRDEEDEAEAAFEKKWNLDAVLLRERGLTGEEESEEGLLENADGSESEDNERNDERGGSEGKLAEASLVIEKKVTPDKALESLERPEVSLSSSAQDVVYDDDDMILDFADSTEHERTVNSHRKVNLSVELQLEDVPPRSPGSPEVGIGLGYALMSKNRPETDPPSAPSSPRPIAADVNDGKKQSSPIQEAPDKILSGEGPDSASSSSSCPPPKKSESKRRKRQGAGRSARCMEESIGISFRRRDSWTREALEELLQVCISSSCKPFLAEVSVLGVEMWSSTKGSGQKLNYVFRVVLSDRYSRSLAPLPSSDAMDELTAFECMGLALGRKVESATSCSRRVFTIRRDLASLAALHAELQRLSKSNPLPQLASSHDVVDLNQDTQSAFRSPPFPDPFQIGMIEEEAHAFLRDGAQGSQGVGIGVGVGLSTGGKGGSKVNRNYEMNLTAGGADVEKDTKKNSYAYHPGFARKESNEVSVVFQSCLDSLRDYLQGVFELIRVVDEAQENSDMDESWHDFSGDYSSSNDDEDDHTADEKQGGVKSSVSTKIILDKTTTQEEVEPLIVSLGRLIGRFLQEGDVEEILDSSNEGTPQPGNPDADKDWIAVETPNKPSPSPATALKPSTQQTLGELNSSTLSKSIVDTARDGRLGVHKNVDSSANLDEAVHIPQQILFGRHEDGSEASLRPSWYRFVTGGVSLEMKVCDEYGGKLSLRNEEELLKGQKSKCKGCGLPIASGFFGLDRNFRPCRYTGGLYCKRWCHGDEHRVIPHRILQYWDVTPHRVCRQAAAFLDSIWNEPLLNLSIINPQLYEGVPTLKQIRSMRERVVTLVGNLLGGNMGGTDIERSSFERRIIDAVTVIIGPRLHLVTCMEPYSLDDLLRAQSGELLDRLQTLFDHLSGEHAVEMYRRKYGLSMSSSDSKNHRNLVTIVR